MKVGIIGAGHAGTAAASVAAEAGEQVVLFSAESVLPYYRPRLISFAFGQADELELMMHPAEWYGEKGIDLRLDSGVEKIDLHRNMVSAAGSEWPFDALIIATGSGPFMPPFVAATHERVIPLWNIEHARVIRSVVRDSRSLLIVGGGILGVEAALRACDAGMSVTIVERMARLMPEQFGVRASAMLLKQLMTAGVEVLVAESVADILPSDKGKILAKLGSTGDRCFDMVLVSVGARRDVTMMSQAGLDTDQGVMVDSMLKTSADHVFAAGDVAQVPGLKRCSALDAVKQGRFAAGNVTAARREDSLSEYVPSKAAVHFMYKEFEIHSVGQQVDNHSKEVTLSDEQSDSCRILVVRKDDDVVMGVQMVGTGSEFKQYTNKMEREESWT